MIFSFGWPKIFGSTGMTVVVCHKLHEKPQSFSCGLMQHLWLASGDSALAEAKQQTTEMTIRSVDAA